MQKILANASKLTPITFRFYNSLARLQINGSTTHNAVENDEIKFLAESKP